MMATDVNCLLGFFGWEVCQLYSVVLFGGWFHKISESSEGLIDMQLGAH